MAKDSALDKEIKNAVASIGRSTAAAAVNNDAAAMTYSPAADDIDQALFSFLKEARRNPSSAVIRAVGPEAQQSKRTLYTASCDVMQVDTLSSLGPKGSNAGRLVPMTLAATSTFGEGLIAADEVKEERERLFARADFLEGISGYRESAEAAGFLVATALSQRHSMLENAVREGVVSKDLFCLTTAPIVAFVLFKGLFGAVKPIMHRSLRSFKLL